MKIINCVYSIQNNLTNEMYIGSTVLFSKRKKMHLESLQKNKHHSYRLQKDWNEYGEQNFSFNILEEIEDKNMLLNREQFWLDNLQPYYNISPTAKSSLGIKRRPETIEKVRQANLGLKHPEWRNKIKSEAQGGENHWTKHKKFSDESKKKMSESQKKLYENGYINPKKGRKIIDNSIIQYDLNLNIISEYKNAAIAGKVLNINRQIIGLCCRGKKDNYNGYIFKFKKDVNEK